MGIDLDLWELPQTPQKKILGVGYSSEHLTNEDKNTVSYKMWMKMIHKCYSQGEWNKKRCKKKYDCCNSWLDYQKFLKWFNNNYKEMQGVSMLLTNCVISQSNTTFNPNNCAIVPKDIFVYLERASVDADKAKELAKKYKDCITEDIYELLTEDY